VALFIKQASGGQTRIVVVGKPRGHAADFDLIVVASHYVLGDAPNVARHALPLNQIDKHALAEVKKAWVGRLLLLPRPLTALLVGGPTGGLRFDVETAKTLLAETRAVVEAQRGSLYVTTSRRTPPAVVEALRAGCTVNDQFYAYDPDTPEIDNPYQGLLSLADDFVVTSDSLSMMVEVAQLERPLRIHPLARERGPVERVLEGLGLLQPIDPRRDPIPAGGVAARTLSRLGWPIHSRDLTAISRRLVEQGSAGWLGEPISPPQPFADNGLDAVAERIRSLVS
jgi:mitochondrial fission protein ELM1